MDNQLASANPQMSPPPETASTLRNSPGPSTQRASSSAHSSSNSNSDSSSEGASSSSSDSDSDSDSQSDSDSDVSVTKEYLDSLIEKAKANMRAAAAANGKGKERAFEEQDVLELDGDEESDREIPKLNPGKLPETYFDFESSSSSHALVLRDIEAERLAASTSVPAPPIPPPELSKDRKNLTKKERKAMKDKTAGPSWFDLPAPDAADLPKLYREYEAMRLRNALDPKQFYRKDPGEGKGIKGLPKHFAIGKIVSTSTPFDTQTSANLSRADRKRTLVDELVDDSEAKRYAKKKFLDLQSVRGARGRGTFAKKFAKRKPKW